MMASQSLSGFDILLSAIDEGSCQQTTPVNIVKCDEASGILLALSSTYNRDESTGCGTRTELPVHDIVSEQTTPLHTTNLLASTSESINGVYSLDESAVCETPIKPVAVVEGTGKENESDVELSVHEIVSELTTPPTKPVAGVEETGEETESDEDTESDTEITEPKEKKVNSSLMVAETTTKINRYDTASELKGCSFEYNGVKIPLYSAEVNGRIQTMLVPCVMVHELVKHWENPLAQKEARRFYVNKLIDACRESGAVLPGTYYIEFVDRRGARFHAIGLDALSAMLLDHESTSAKKWVKLANQLINTPADKKPPRKRKRNWVSDSFSNRKNPVCSS